MAVFLTCSNLILMNLHACCSLELGSKIKKDEYCRMRNIILLIKKTSKTDGVEKLVSDPFIIF